MLDDRAQRHNHRIAVRNLCRAGVKLPRAVIVVVRDVENRLAEAQDLCCREDRDVPRVCKRPILCCALCFHVRWDLRLIFAFTALHGFFQSVAKSLAPVTVHCFSIGCSILMQELPLPVITQYGL